MAKSLQIRSLLALLAVGSTGSLPCNAQVPSLFGMNGFANSRGWGINSAGEVCGTQYAGPKTPHYAFYWTGLLFNQPGTAVRLPGNGAAAGNPGTWTEGHSISEIDAFGGTWVAGNVIVVANNANRHACYWYVDNNLAPSGPFDLGTLGGDQSWATGVNIIAATGASPVVGYSQTVPGARTPVRAFLTPAAQLNAAAMLPLGGTLVTGNNRANAINVLGTPVGWTDTRVQGVTSRHHACFWTPGAGAANTYTVFDLHDDANQAIDEDYSSANGINSNGTIIVGETDAKQLTFENGGTSYAAVWETDGRGGWDYTDISNAVTQAAINAKVIAMGQTITQSAAFGVNSANPALIVGAYQVPGKNLWRGFLYNNALGAATDLGAANGLPNAQGQRLITTGRGINDSGQIVGSIQTQTQFMVAPLTSAYAAP